MMISFFMLRNFWGNEIFPKFQNSKKQNRRVSGSTTPTGRRATAQQGWTLLHFSCVKVKELVVSGSRRVTHAPYKRETTRPKWWKI
jgi:hypothetical protein